LCFERSAEPLTDARLKPVLENALGPDTRIELVDFSRYPVPPGEIVFSAADLMRTAPSAAESAVIWRGHVRYGSRSSAAVWAKVKVSRAEQWVETSRPLRAGAPITVEDVVLKTGWRFPSASKTEHDLNDVLGRVTTRALPSGHALVPAELTAANEIERGDAVDVEVKSGDLLLRFPALAETSGRRNQLITVSAAAGIARRFQARVQEKGKVLVYVDPRTGSGTALLRGPARPPDGRNREKSEEAGAR
jgi:flagella basal body P-ring formation protein FlgA